MLIAYESSNNLYALIRAINVESATQGWVFLNTLASPYFEAWGTSSRDETDYGIDLTDMDGNSYKLVLGSGDTSDLPKGHLQIDFYVRTGGSNDLTADIRIASERITWDGSNERYVINTDGRVDVGEWLGVAATLNTDTDKPSMSVEDIESSVLQEIVSAIWDEPIGTHEVSGSFGEQCGVDIDAILTDTANIDSKMPTGNLLDADDVAAAIWDEATSGHTTAGTFGEQLKTDIDAILVDTNEIQGKMPDDGGDLVSADDVATAVLDAALSDHKVAGSVGEVLAIPDTYLVTTTTPWRLKLTYPGDVSQVIEQKNLYDTSGAVVTTTDQVIGKQTQV